jgi:nucleoid DNA-binding protein
MLSITVIIGEKGIIMRELKRDELISMLSIKSGVTKKETEKILKSLDFVVYNSIIRGFMVRIPGIGKFEPKPVKERKEARNYGGKDFLGNDIIIPPTPAFCRPSFTFVNQFKQKVKEATTGRVYERKEDKNG